MRTKFAGELPFLPPAAGPNDVRAGVVGQLDQKPPESAAGREYQHPLIRSEVSLLEQADRGSAMMEQRGQRR